MKLHYAGYQPEASGFGWATCNAALVLELGKLVDLYGPAANPVLIERDVDVVFMPLADHDFNPVSPARGKVNLAYTFFEFPLGPNAAENAKKYDIVFAGSTWCLDRMREAGIQNGKLLIQGVDRNVFINVVPRKPDRQFRIFSGGKFEYRKGQDLVIAAFKEFSRRREDAHLVCSWFNPWPNLIRSMFQSKAIDFGVDKFESHEWDHFLAGPGQTGYFCAMLKHFGIEGVKRSVLPQLSQPDLAYQMQNTDVGLFPNRCEGGTNLVLMEYACCGRKVIANAKTGHWDIASAITYRIPAKEDENHWAAQTVDDIVEELEIAYLERDSPEHWARSAYRSDWTWEAAANKIVNTAHSILKSQRLPLPPRPTPIDLASV